MPTTRLTALLVLAVVPVGAVVVLVAIVAAGPDVAEWVPPALALVFAGLTSAFVTRARGASYATATAFGLGAAVVSLGLIHLLTIGLIELIDGPGGP